MAKVATFRHGRKYLSNTARRAFYLSIIQSTLDYASNAYVHSFTAHLLDRMVVTSHICIKRVFGLHRQTSTDLVLRLHNLYSFEQRINLKLFVLVYRSLNCSISPLVKNMFTLRAARAHTSAVTRGQRSSALVLPAVYSRFGSHSVSFLAADRWNSLPSDCRQAQSLPDFVSQLKLFLGFPVRRPRPVGPP